MTSHLGLIGLGVMGQSLARNFANRGFTLSVYNRTTADMQAFIAEHGSELLIGYSELRDFVRSLRRPRKIVLMVSAGPAVDAVIASLRPFLEKGDIIIDGGNSHFRDTERRFTELKALGFEFIGCGVSGGEAGALHGPSMMPGGSKRSWQAIKKYFEPAAARDFAGGPCVAYMGPRGAGHFVKMEHNGIEYTIMQLLAEVYALYHDVYKMRHAEIADIFERYSRGRLRSFLVEIAVPVLRAKEGKRDLLDLILDKSASKGTGKWTIQDALDRGIAVPGTAEAMFARSISGRKDDRVTLAKRYPHSHPKPFPKADAPKTIERALYAGVIIAFAQGLDLIRTASIEERWHIDLGEVIRVWQGGCIIRADLLKDLAIAVSEDRYTHLFASSHLQTKISSAIPALRRVVAGAATAGLATPAFSSSLAYFDQMTSSRLPANFIQGLRDSFGAHTYERIDRSGSFHTNWDTEKKSDKSF